MLKAAGTSSTCWQCLLEKSPIDLQGWSAWLHSGESQVEFPHFLQVSLHAHEIILSIHAHGKAKMADQYHPYGFRNTLCPHVSNSVRLREPLGELRPCVIAKFKESDSVLEAIAAPKVLNM